jgi:hypothetical protein
MAAKKTSERAPSTKGKSPVAEAMKQAAADDKARAAEREAAAANGTEQVVEPATPAKAATTPAKGKGKKKAAATPDGGKAAADAPQAAQTAKPAPKGKKAKEPKPETPKRLSALDAAAQVLAKSKEPMSAREMIAAVVKAGLWTSPAGKTPDATLYSAIIREISAKGADSRFAKVARGRFASNGKRD